MHLLTVKNENVVRNFLWMNGRTSSCATSFHNSSTIDFTRTMLKAYRWVYYTCSTGKNKAFQMDEVSRQAVSQWMEEFFSFASFLYLFADSILRAKKNEKWSDTSSSMNEQWIEDFSEHFRFFLSFFLFSSLSYYNFQLFLFICLLCVCLFHIYTFIESRKRMRRTIWWEKWGRKKRTGQYCPEKENVMKNNVFDQKNARKKANGCEKKELRHWKSFTLKAIGLACVLISSMDEKKFWARIFLSYVHIFSLSFFQALVFYSSFFASLKPFCSFLYTLVNF